MKWIGKTAACLVGMLIFDASAQGNGNLAMNNPYATIVTRNVFGLQPLPIVNPPAPSAQALPKIMLNGITSILGPPAVLFKVKEQISPGQVTGNKCYLLREGETQDGIEVTRVDEGAGVVFFDNHGTLQQIMVGAEDDLSGAMSEGFHHPFD